MDVESQGQVAGGVAECGQPDGALPPELEQRDGRGEGHPGAEQRPVLLGAEALGSDFRDEVRQWENSFLIGNHFVERKVILIGAASVTKDNELQWWWLKGHFYIKLDGFYRLEWLL